MTGNCIVQQKETQGVTKYKLTTEIRKLHGADWQLLFISLWGLKKVKPNLIAVEEARLHKKEAPTTRLTLLPCSEILRPPGPSAFSEERDTVCSHSPLHPEAASDPAIWSNEILHWAPRTQSTLLSQRYTQHIA